MGVLEQPDHRSGKKRGEQVDLQPGEPFAHGERRTGQCALVGAGSHHGLDVGAGLLLDRGHQGGLADRADEAAVVVDHGQLGDRMLLQHRHHVLARVEVLHRGQRRSRDLAQRAAGIGHGQIVDLDPAGEASFVVHDEQLAQAAALERAQAGERVRHRHAGPQRAHVGIHQASGRAVRILQQLAQFAGDLAVQRREPAGALLRVELGEHGGARRGLGLREQMSARACRGHTRALRGPRRASARAQARTTACGGCAAISSPISCADIASSRRAASCGKSRR